MIIDHDQSISKGKTFELVKKSESWERLSVMIMLMC